MTNKDATAIETLDRDRLLEEVEHLERMVLDRGADHDSGDAAGALALVRIIRGMTRHDWDELVHRSPVAPAWIPLPLQGDKASLLTDLQQRLETLLHASNRDPLTGLFNRGFFQRVLRREMDRTRKYRMPLTVVIIDVDDFKAVNDTYGHVFGDRVLKQLGDHIGAGIRAGDYAARIGGEEFALILPGTGMTAAEPVLRRIGERAPEALSLRKDWNGCTLSLGSATWNGTPPLLPEVFLEHADRELYRVKGSGKNDFRMVLVSEDETRSMVGSEEKDFLARGRPNRAASESPDAAGDAGLPHE